MPPIRRAEPQIPVELALYQPEIAPNAGAMLRLGACLGVPVHIIHPTGFAFSRRALRRGGLDYVEHADIIEHDSYAHFADWLRAGSRRLVLLSTKAGTSAYVCRYAPGDVLLVGRESAGVPAAIAAAADLAVRIPMRQDRRSLNVATAASLVLGEALRQTGGFLTLK
ncbi:tRNA (cytidine(34)-2'-O)-methyltransferase [Devosia sp.]|uniref:tRNA (cytidine(34)-2'-O)-methyltransferase n=1 Tax=Devosia sp. TaxID=1871048 RepID=UPI002EF93F03